MASAPYVLRMRRISEGRSPRAGLASRRPHTDAGEEGCEGRLTPCSRRAIWEGGGGAPNFGKWWSQLRKDPEFDPALCFLAADHEGVIGIAQCWTTDFVKDIAVDPRARRRGVGPRPDADRVRSLQVPRRAACRSQGARGEQDRPGDVSTSSECRSSGASWPESSIHAILRAANLRFRRLNLL